MATLADLFRRLFSRSTPVSVPRPTAAPRSKTRSRLIGGGAAAAALLALVTTEALHWESLETTAYRDVVGVWTICIGETKGVRPGMRFTADECKSKFATRIVEFEADMRRCLSAPDAIPGKTYAAFLLATYNIGGGNFCKSSMARRANAGDLRGACDALLMWNKGGQPLRVIRGLTNRRQAERKLCLEGLR
ncbi:lysozyme [Aurantimonas sp. DM33-3]|uniref:lysozyme n=1 Tax=Aurantimonas sp. DM33-3 TaxID=2766955 RepID=UPI0016529605|nr:lysozyme [Aurantimonas sp. DM33-3]MBC6716904.1 lysozyme [Aurantimonas sp. DM33-3]